MVWLLGLVHRFVSIYSSNNRLRVPKERGGKKESFICMKEFSVVMDFKIQNWWNGNVNTHIYSMYRLQIYTEQTGVATRPLQHNHLTTQWLAQPISSAWAGVDVIMIDVTIMLTDCTAMDGENKKETQNNSKRAGHLSNKRTNYSAQSTS